MPFVKLDCGILNSTLWAERTARELFLTALLMAEPYETTTALPQIATRGFELTGWSVPPGWYGFVHAASVGILARAQIPENDAAWAALTSLGEPDTDSRSADFDGRRLVRVDGGWIVLNYMKYRERDYTGADRAKRYRERKRLQRASRRDDAVSRRDITQAERGDAVSHRDITQAEVEVEVEVQKTKRTRSRSLSEKAPPEEPKTPEPRGQTSAGYTTEAVAEAARRFLDRYPAVYAEVLRGAVYPVRPVRDYAAACALVTGWPDAAYLERMLRAFLVHPDRLKPGTPAQFLALAPEIDAELRAPSKEEADAALRAQQIAGAKAYTDRMARIGRDGA